MLASWEAGAMLLGHRGRWQTLEAAAAAGQMHIRVAQELSITP